MSTRLMSKVPESVARAPGVPIERAGSAEEIAGKIREGKAFLRIVSTPWGVDFYVCEAGEKA